MESLLAVLPQPTPEYLVNNLVRINRTALAAGYTRTQDATTGGVLGAAEVGLFHQADFTGRVGYAILDPVADEILSNGLTPFAGDDLCRATAWKFVADGSTRAALAISARTTSGGSFAEARTTTSQPSPNACGEPIAWVGRSWFMPTETAKSTKP